ncbi:MAG: membrane protein insertion efficiency factor YidD [Candidatus Neomarinimicrobiota bacterium]
MIKKIKLRQLILCFLFSGGLALSQESQKWPDYWETPRPLIKKTELISSVSLFKSSAFVWIRIYQKAISSQDLPSCVFHPSCSRFAFTAINEFGAIKGILLAGDRLMRCNPFAVHYYPFDGEKMVDPPQNYRLK